MITALSGRLPDIFTDPADVAPDTLACRRPLGRMAGRRLAVRGLDVSADRNTSKRTFPARPNPWAAILASCTSA